jgi:peptidyl-prolyl cis-trans isomerase B (cyclophilin B)
LKPNPTSPQPFFEVGKAIGDKRATVAEKGFNRPLKRAIVASAGLL